MASELRDNPRGLDVTADAPGWAHAVLDHLVPRSVAPERIRWLVRHGWYSSYDPAGPETLTELGPGWDGQRFLDDVHHHRLIPVEQARELAARWRLEPVDVALAALGQPAPRRFGTDGHSDLVAVAVAAAAGRGNDAAHRPGRGDADRRADLQAGIRDPRRRGGGRGVPAGRRGPGGGRGAGHRPHARGAAGGRPRSRGRAAHRGADRGVRRRAGRRPDRAGPGPRRAAQLRVRHRGPARGVPAGVADPPGTGRAARPRRGRPGGACSAR